MPEKCRLCSVEGRSKNKIAFDQLKNNAGTIASAVETLSGVQIKENDPYTKKVCFECVEKLEESLEFCRIIVSTDLSLKSASLDFLEKGENLINFVEIKEENNGKGEEEASVKKINKENKRIDESDEEDKLLDTSRERDNFPEILETDSNDDSNLAPPPLQPDVSSHSPPDSPVPTTTTTKKTKRKNKCKVCGLQFPSYHKLTIHRAEHTGIVPYECPSCDKRFFTAYKLKDHQIKHAQERPFKCDACEYTAKTKNALNSHMLYRHFNYRKGGDGDEADNEPPRKLYKCPQCEKTFKQQFMLDDHVLSHTNPTPYVCEFCGRGYVFRGALKEHIKYNHREKPVSTCAECGKSYTCPSSYRQHLLTHKEPEHMCTVCGRQFKIQKHLKRHMQAHDGVKPYACELCGKTFAQSTTLKYHMLVHTGEKPYECAQCAQRFTYLQHIQKHVIKMHTKCDDKSEVNKLIVKLKDL